MKKAYKAWAEMLAKNNPQMSTALTDPYGLNGDYNYMTAFSAGLPPEAGHLGDIGKKPNHPTFSNEAFGYANDPRAGKWIAPVSDGAQWLYHNPGRGLFFAPEADAYSAAHKPYNSKF